MNAMIYVVFVFILSLIIISRYSNPLSIKLIDISLLILASILYFVFASYIPNSYAQKDIYKFIVYWIIPVSILLADMVIILRNYPSFYPSFSIIFAVAFVFSLLYTHHTLIKADSEYNSTQTWQEQSFDFSIALLGYILILATS